MKKTAGAFSLSALFIIGNSIVVVRNPYADENIYLMFIFALVLSLPLFALYAALFRRMRCDNVIDLYTGAFGPYISKLVLAFVGIYALMSAMGVLSGTLQTVQINALPATPRFWLSLLLLPVLIYAVLQGENTLRRFAMFVIPAVALLFAAGIVSSFARADIKYIYPLFGKSVQSTVRGSLIFLIIPFSEIFMLPALGYRDKGGLKCMLGVIAGAVLISLIYLRNQTVLGDNWTYGSESYKYVVSRYTDVGAMVQRLTLPSVTMFLVCDVLKICVQLYFSVRALSSLAGGKGTKALGVIMPCVIGAMVIFADTLSDVSRDYTVFFIYLGAAAGLAVPLLAALISLFRKPLHNK